MRTPLDQMANATTVEDVVVGFGPDLRETKRQGRKTNNDEGIFVPTVHGQLSSEWLDWHWIGNLTIWVSDTDSAETEAFEWRETRMALINVTQSTITCEGGVLRRNTGS